MSSPKFRVGDTVKVVDNLIGVIKKVNMGNKTYLVKWNHHEELDYGFGTLEGAAKKIKSASKSIKRVTNVQAR